RPLETGDLLLTYGDVVQTEHPNRPLHQVDTTTGAVDQHMLGLGEHDRQRDPGKTHTGAQIPQDRGYCEELGVDQRIGDVPILDPIGLTGSDATGGKCLGEQPVVESMEKCVPIRSEWVTEFFG